MTETEPLSEQPIVLFKVGCLDYDFTSYRGLESPLASKVAEGHYLLTGHTPVCEPILLVDKMEYKEYTGE